MLDCSNQTILSLLFGCLACLAGTSVVNADGRVFVLDLRNSSGLQGFRDAEGACASQHARLASAEELHHAVVECFFSPCTRGWLYGGAVGTTVCNVVGSALKAVDVRTENATEDAAHLDAFCIKDKGVPCGDPPSFPSARLQGHTGYEMGDELLYSCVPGYVMPSGHTAFSLLCDSCGEWYGLVEICVKDETESHVDYEDKFTDSYGDAERHTEMPEEAHGEVYEEVHGAAYPEREGSQEQLDTSFSVRVEEEHQEDPGEHESEGAVEGEEKDGDFISQPRWEQERREVIRTDAATATEAPVSLLSQKHLFWFPSEAFQEEGHPFSTNPVTQNTQRASGAQSEESKEHESQETHHQQRPVDVDDRDHEQDSYDRDDLDDHDDSNHDDQDAHDDSHGDLDDPDSRRAEDDHARHYIPAQHDDLDRRERHKKPSDHHDHYDMGEHEEDRDRDRDRVRYGSQEYDDTYNEHESYEERDDVTVDRGDDDQEHPDGSEEHPEPDDHDDHVDHVEHVNHDEHVDRDDHDDHVDHEDHDDHVDRDDHVDHDDHDDRDDHVDRDDHDDRDDHVDRDDHDDHVDREDHDDHDDSEEHYDPEEEDHDDHEHDDNDSYDDHDSHEDDGHQHVTFSIAVDEHQNATQKGPEGEATTDDTWLDGYPVVQQETGNGGTVVRATDRPSEVEIRRRGPYTSSPEVAQTPTAEPALDQGGVEEVWPGFIPTAAPSQASGTPSYSDTLDYDTQQAAPTHSWLGDLTENPFLDHGPVPPMHDGDSVVMEGNNAHHLPGEAGERGEAEGEMGEAICTGDDCPPRPPSSSSRGPTVAAVIVAVCAVATAAVIGVWCYRRQQQKSSMYKMNGKGQSQTSQGQQIEMQQKV